VPVLHEQVIVRRRHVDVAGLDRLLVAGLAHRPLDVPLQERLEDAAVRLDRPVQGDHDRLVELARDPLEQRTHGLQPSPRRPDGDHLVTHAIFL
jgi:hypothetical protein